MATLGNLVVAVKADTSQHASGMRKAQSGQDALRRSALRLGATLVGIFGARQILRGVRSIADAFTTQEDAVVGLRASLVATGKAGEASLRQLTRSAAELQKVTRQGDEAIIAATASLAQLAPALDTNELEQAQKAIIGIAETFTKGNLDSAAQLIGKSIGSTTNALTRYGIELDTSATAGEKLADIVDQSNTFFEVAKARANTTGGALVQLGNTFGDVKEAIGKLLATGTGFAPFLQRVTATLAAIATILSGSTSQIERMFTLLGVIAGNAFSVAVLSVIVKMPSTLNRIFTRMTVEAAKEGKLFTAVFANLLRTMTLSDVAVSGFLEGIKDEAKANIAGAVTELLELEATILALGPAVIETADEAGTGLANFGKQVSDLQQGVQGAFTSLVVNIRGAFDQMEDDERTALQRMADAVEQFAAGVERTLLELAAKELGKKLFGSLSGAGGLGVGGALAIIGGSILSSVFHSGGVVGRGGPSRMVPALAFAGAPSFAGGGIAGLGSQEVPAILHKGETVLPVGATGGGGTVIVNQEINLVVNAMDGRTVSHVLKEQSGTIAQIVFDAAQDGAGFRRGLRGR